MKIKIPKFCGYDSAMNVYTFRETFVKTVVPYVQKPLLPDTLKLNYLGDPAVTMVTELTSIEKIWVRVFKSYDDAGVLL